MLRKEKCNTSFDSFFIVASNQNTHYYITRPPGKQCINHGTFAVCIAWRHKKNAINSQTRKQTVFCQT